VRAISAKEIAMPIKSIEVPSQSRLRELFDYDAAAGALIWRPRPLSDFKNHQACNACNTRFAGKVAGSINKVKGYRNIRIGCAQYRAHRLVYAWHHGACSADLQIDHINGNRLDNRIENLRLATHAQNNQNVSKRRNNTSDFKGVSLHQQSRKFRAQICINGRKKHLGIFATAQEAGHAYAQAAAQLHGDFTHQSVHIQNQSGVSSK
jgi:hypothetical protein